MFIKPQSTTDNEEDSGVLVTPTPPDIEQTNKIGSMELAGQLATEPDVLVYGQTSLADSREDVDTQKVKDGEIKGDDPKYQLDKDGVNQTADTATAAQATAATPKNNVEAQTATALEDMENLDLEAAQGSLSQGSQVDTTGVEIDTDAIAQGLSETGKALGAYAEQGMSHIIDTSTVAGRQLAEQLGEGNYVDSKATVAGQLAILQEQFKDANGDPTIPAWAAGAARQVGKMIAFDGVAGTAAMAAMSQAIMEASLPIASQDAQFFQTVTLSNLSNKQESIINKANILSKFAMANMDSRMTAAVTNANNFMQMDLANLTNEQQARVIEGQGRIQAILEDANQENVTARFNAQNENELNQFYDSLNSQIQQYNASEANAMRQFNSSATNSMRQFNAQLENDREKYYMDNQYRIDQSNAQWRREVTLTETQQKFEAQATDVRNMLDISMESMNQLWDRADALLDYAWKSSENEADRNAAIAMEKLKAKIKSDDDDATATGNFLGKLFDIGVKLLFGF